MSLLQKIRKHGILHTLRGTAWQGKTALRKGWLLYRWRKGWISYDRWAAQVQPSKQIIPSATVPKLAAEQSPRISFLVPVRNQERRWLDLTIESIFEQDCPDWEVVIVDQGDGRGAHQDARIRYVTVDPRVSASDLVITALNDARGETCVLLKPGDQVSTDFITQISREMEQEVAPAIVYTDEDILGSDGRRESPFFKPSWSPELLFSVHYLLHAAVNRKLLRTEMEQTDGPVDYGELIMRIADKSERINHIPQALVHLIENKKGSEEVEQQRSWAQSRLERLGFSKGLAEVTPRGQVRVRWLPSGRKVSIIIPTRDHVDTLARCLSSILTKTSYPHYEILLVENGSREAATRDYYRSMARELRIRICVYNGGFNYNTVNNFGARHAQGELLLFLNNDVEVLDADWLDELVRWVELPGVGAAGGRLLFPDGSIQHQGIVVGMEGHASHVFGGLREEAHPGPYGDLNWYRDFTAVTGACLMTRRELFEKIGGFDERFQLVFSDVELGMRLNRAGYRVVCTPFCRLIHHEGRTRARYIPEVDMQLGFDRLYEMVESGDPYYNPNLSTAVRIPVLKQLGEEPALQRLEKIVKYL